MLDDITLIRKYLRQESILLSNPQLRVQAASETAVQLMSRRGELLATADFTALPPTIRIRPKTDYETLLHEMLVAHHFLPQGQCEDQDLACYSYHPVPDGYSLHVTPALDFWKKWWSRYRSLTPVERGGSQTDLMLFTHRKWYPVRDVISDRGTLFIKTWVGETAHTATDQVVWLAKAEPAIAEDKTQFFFPQTPAEKAKLQQQCRPPAQSPSPATSPRSVPRREVPATAAHSGGGCPIGLRPVPAGQLHQVARYHQGKLYVQTPLGYLAVEGENLKYALVTPRA